MGSEVSTGQEQQDDKQNAGVSSSERMGLKSKLSRRNPNGSSSSLNRSATETLRHATSSREKIFPSSKEPQAVRIQLRPLSAHDCFVHLVIVFVSKARFFLQEGSNRVGSSESGFFQTLLFILHHSITQELVLQILQSSLTNQISRVVMVS